MINSIYDEGNVRFSSPAPTFAFDRGPATLMIVSMFVLSY